MYFSLRRILLMVVVCKTLAILARIGPLGVRSTFTYLDMETSVTPTCCARSFCASPFCFSKSEICFISLTMLRVLQLKTQKSIPANADKDTYWSYGMSGNKLTNILYDWKADMFSGDYYRMTHSDVDELKKISFCF